jgi:lambda family phage portal protein
MKVKDPTGDLDSDANTQIEEAWKRWGKKQNCCVDKRLSWRQVCNIALKSRKRDGGFLIRYYPYWKNDFAFALQLIEVDHLDTYYNVPVYYAPENKEPVAYWLWTRHPGDYNSSAAFNRERIPADEILHLYLSDRAHATIGVPEISSAMPRMQMLNGYEEAEVTAARVAACKGGYIQKEKPDEYVGDGNENGNNVEEMEPGVVRELDPGETFVEHDPKHPNTAYGPFTKTVLRGIASGLMISYNSLSNDLEGVNYSSIRAGVLEDREEYKMEQEDFIEDWCEPVFAKWLPFAILSGQVKLPLAKLQKFLDGATWQGRRWPWVDPLKDIQAAVIALDKRLASRTGVLADNGEDFDKLLDEIEEEERLAAEKGVELSIADNEPIPVDDEAPSIGSKPSQEQPAGESAPKKKKPKK